MWGTDEKAARLLRELDERKRKAATTVSPQAAFSPAAAQASPGRFTSGASPAALPANPLRARIAPALLSPSSFSGLRRASMRRGTLDVGAAADLEARALEEAERRAELRSLGLERWHPNPERQRAYSYLVRPENCEVRSIVSLQALFWSRLNIINNKLNFDNFLI